MKIVVLAGGLSTERNVALTSGTGICRALRRRGHKAVLVDMFMGLENYSGALEDIFDAPDGLCADHSVSAAAPDLEAVRRSRKDQSPSLLGQGVLQVCAMADLVFLALHGSCGEDGRMQATLDLLGVPYTGSNYISSGMAMDKAITKRFMDAEGIRTAPWHDVRYTEADIPALVSKLETPCAVKIVNGGSSIGVELPDTKEELADTLRRMLRYGDHVAPITEAEWRQVGEMALKLHKALGLSVYSRTDFILDEDGKAWCLEVNTLPGMTPTSLVPQEAAAVGMDYDTLCETIAEESLRVRKAERL